MKVLRALGGLMTAPLNEVEHSPVDPDRDGVDSSSALRKAPVALLGAAAFVVSADTRVVTPLLPVVAHNFQTTIGAAGSLVTAYALPYGLLQIMYGPLGDRVGKFRVMVWAMALFAFGTAACALAPSLLGLDALRFLTGMAAAAMIPLSLAYIGDQVPYADRQAAIAKLLGAIALGSILSTSLGGVVADFLSWRIIFLVYGVASIGVFALLWRASRTAPDTRTSASGGLASALHQYGRLLQSGESRLVMMAVLIEGTFFFGGFSYLGAFLRDRYDLLYVFIGLLLAIYGVGNFAYARLAKVFIRLLGERWQTLAGGLLLAVSFLVIVFAPGVWIFAAMMLVMGVAFNLIHSTLQTKATELAPHARGAALSLFAFCLFVGQGIGAAALGIVVTDSGYPATFLLSGLPVAALALLLLWRLPMNGPGENLSRNLEADVAIIAE